MNNRKSKLEKALADLPKRQFTLRGDPSDESSWKWEVNPPPQAFWDDGLYVDVDEMEFRLKPLHAALVEAVEALEFYSNMRFNREKMEWMPGGPDHANTALAKLDQILKGDQNEK